MIRALLTGCTKQIVVFKTIVFPPHGLTNYHSKEQKIHWAPFTGLESVEFAADALDKLLKKNNLNIEDISCFLLSQFTKSNIDILQDKIFPLKN